MTELTSQAYAKKSEYFVPSAQLKVLVAEPDNPLSVSQSGRGRACFIDLGNIDSCAFILSEDLVEVREDGCFRVLGRLDHSDVRGCSQMY